MDVENSRKRISALLKDWVKNGALKIVEREDSERHKRKYVEVGTWAVE